MKVTAATSKTPEEEEGERHQHGICTEVFVGWPGDSLVCAIHTVLKNTGNNTGETFTLMNFALASLLGV